MRKMVVDSSYLFSFLAASSSDSLSLLPFYLWFCSFYCCQFVTRQYLVLPTAMLDITWRDLAANERGDSGFSKRENHGSCHFIAVTFLCNVTNAGLAGVRTWKL
ncbi:hypothetical protein Droror1_Dr00018086 [Drosera rotundifolia]